MVKKSKMQKSADRATNYTEIPSLTTYQYKNEFIFDLLKRDRTLNFQKKLIKKLIQLIFPKNDDNKSCMSAIVII